MEFETYRALGLERSFGDDDLSRVVNGRSFFPDIGTAMSAPGDAPYHPCPEASPGDDVPRGTIDRISGWRSSERYPGTTRDVWIYSSPGVRDATESPSLMVFNDGAWYADPEGPTRVPAVLDSLVAAGERPPSIALFVKPGVPDGAAPDMGDLASFQQRSIEYDSCDDSFVSFLEREVLPMAEDRTGVRFTTDPTRRLIGGISSGGICAFNAAWHRPDLFGLVLSHCGSYVNIRGGNNFPYLVRTTDKKPIRVFMQSGAADLNTVFGKWSLANQDLAAALAYAGYEFRFEFGSGGHSLRHGGALMADSIRWLTTATAGADALS